MNPEFSKFRAAVQKHGIILDTNILILYIVGLTSPDKISQNKKTSRYDYRHLDFIKGLVSICKGRKPIITPHLLPEVDHMLSLSSNKASSTSKSRYLEAAIHVIKGANEINVPAKCIMNNQAFIRFGATDISIMELAKNGYAVLTDDLILSDCLKRMKISAMTFDDYNAAEYNAKHQILGSI